MADQVTVSTTDQLVTVAPSTGVITITSTGTDRTVTVSQRGLQGGASTSSAQIVTPYIAGEAVGGQRVVYIGAGDKVFHADSTDQAQLNKVVGITATAASLGAMVNVLSLGKLADASFSFTSGSPLFFNSVGVLTHTAPTSGFVQKVGVAIKSNEILADMQLPYSIL